MEQGAKRVNRNRKIENLSRELPNEELNEFVRLLFNKIEAIQLHPKSLEICIRLNLILQYGRLHCSARDIIICPADNCIPTRFSASTRIEVMHRSKDSKGVVSDTSSVNPVDYRLLS